MKDMIYEKILSGETINSPEKIAFIFKKAKVELSQIKNELLKRVYHNYIFTKISDSFIKLPNSQIATRNYEQKKTRTPRVIKTTKEEILLYIICMYPKILDDVFEQFATLDIDEKLKSNIIEIYSKSPDISSEVFIDKIKNLSYNALLDKILNSAVCINFLSHTGSHTEIVSKWMSVFNEIFADNTATNRNGMLKNWARIKNLKRK